jgi:hypothetical protein
MSVLRQVQDDVAAAGAGDAGGDAGQVAADGGAADLAVGESVNTAW